MGKFIKREDGIWDAPNCSECCSDCSAGDEDCGDCPVVFEDSCDNCIFKNGYKKCGECHTNAPTQNDKYIQMGYSWMCDECIKKWSK